MSQRQRALVPLIERQVLQVAEQVLAVRVGEVRDEVHHEAMEHAHTRLVLAAGRAPQRCQVCTVKVAGIRQQLQNVRAATDRT